jgi:nickel-dependent lactate racemase
MLKPEDTVAVVVDDHTRTAPSKVMVSTLLEKLDQIGVEDRNIAVIFGCGTHRAVKPEEVAELLGEDLANRVRVTSHDCRSEDQVFLGTTKNGKTKVTVNKVFAEADFRILTGDIEPHYFAGYGGGRKSVLPGIASIEAIKHNHSLMLHPNARTGILKGNPVHEDMLEAAKLARVDFLLNVVSNGEGAIVKAFAGDLEQAFFEGVRLVEEMCIVPIDRRADILIASPGGHPSDVNLYQACKSLDNVLDCVKRGGVIILVAECVEGYGSRAFYEWMKKFQDLKSMEREMRKRFVVGGHKAYYLLKALQKAQVILVSTLPDQYAVNIFKLRTARAVNDALEEAFKIQGRNAKILAISHGHSILPRYRG